MRTRLGHATAAVVLPGVLLVLVPGSASAAQGGTDRPLRSDGEVTTVLDLCASPFSGTIEGSFRGSHIGNATSALDFVIAPGTGVQTGSGTLTAANGDVLVVTFSGIITDTSPTHNTSTSVFTITGGTGRFEDATGTFTVDAVGANVSTIGCTAILRHTTTTIDGTISY
jgi:hypothetical protein